MKTRHDGGYAPNGEARCARGLFSELWSEERLVLKIVSRHRLSWTKTSSDLCKLVTKEGVSYIPSLIVIGQKVSEFDVPDRRTDTQTD